MFKGRVEKVSHEGGLLVSYTGACPALGSVMVDSGENYIGKVDGVIGNLNNSLSTHRSSRSLGTILATWWA